MESHIRGTWEKRWVLASVAEGRDGVGPHKIVPTPQQAYRPTSYKKAVLLSASPTPCHPLRTQQTWECRTSGRAGFNNFWKATTTGAVPALACLTSGGLQPHGATPNTASPWKRPAAQKSQNKLGQAVKSSAYILRQSFELGCPGEEPLGFRVAR